MLLSRVLERTRYLEHLADEAGEGPDERRANVEELVAAAGGRRPPRAAGSRNSWPRPRWSPMPTGSRRMPIACCC